MTLFRPRGHKIFSQTIYVRVPPATEGCESAIPISAKEFHDVVDSDYLSDDSYESWLPSGRVITADRLRDRRHRLNPRRPAPSPSIVKNVLLVQSEMITIRRLLGRVAAGTDGFESMSSLAAWMRTAADYFELLAKEPACPPTK